MENGGQKPTFARVLQDLKDLLLEDLEKKVPGTKRIAGEIDKEAGDLFDQYRATCLTEIHAMRLINLIMSDLEALELIPLQKARGLLIEAEEVLFRHLILTPKAREIWERRRELRKMTKVGTKEEG